MFYHLQILRIIYWIENSEIYSLQENNIRSILNTDIFYLKEKKSFSTWLALEMKSWFIVYPYESTLTNFK